MSSNGRRKFNGLDFALLIIIDFAFINFISATRPCREINGHALCYFKEWDFGVDWDTAWELCNSRNATLPAIRNQNEQDVLEKFLNMHIMSGSAVWTSGRNYTYNDWTWLDGRPYSEIQDYGYLIHSYNLYDENRHFLSRHYICGYSGDVCKYFNDTLNVTNGCIILSDDRRSWYDARNQCLMAGGDLAVLGDADLDPFNIHYETLYRYFRKRWIGWRKTSWRWNLNKNASEEDEIKYTNWSDDWDPLIGECISIDASNGTWRTTECSDKLKVVCQTGHLLASVEQEESQSVSYPTFISVMSVCICAIVISNIIVAFVVRKYVYHRTAHVTSSSETTANMRYEDIETTRRQANPDDTYTELQLQPVYEVC